MKDVRHGFAKVFPYSVYHGGSIAFSGKYGKVLPIQRDPVSLSDWMPVGLCRIYPTLRIQFRSYSASIVCYGVAGVDLSTSITGTSCDGTKY